MPAQERTYRVVQTSTLTDDVHQIRRHLRRLGVALFVLTAWLGLSISLCSIHPELSTVNQHPLGAVSEWVSSGLLEHLGLMSFSLCLLLGRLAWMLVRLQLPVVTAFDFASYAMINVLSTFPLAVFMKGCTLFGAPYGGAIGERFLRLFEGVSSPYLELDAMMILLLATLTYLHVSTKFGASSDHHGSGSPGGPGGGAEAEGEPALTGEQRQAQPASRPSERSSIDMLSARSVKSAPQALLSQLRAELTEDEGEYSELTGLDPVDEEPIFQLESQARAPSAPADALISLPLSSIYRPEQGSNTPSAGLLSPSESARSIYQPQSLHVVTSQVIAPQSSAPSSPAARELQIGSVSRPLDPYRRAESASSWGEGGHRESPSSGALARGQKRSPHEELTHRKAYIARLLEQLGLGVKGLQAELGEVTSAISVTLEEPHRLSIEQLPSLNERLNSFVKKSFGRTEPSLLLLPQGGRRGEELKLQITWPHRSPQFAHNKKGIEENRARRESNTQLMLYMGDLSNGCAAYLPFKQLPSLLVTGGAQTDPQLGLNLLLMSLIYQAREDELRFLVAAPSVGHRPTRSPWDGHPQLFSPVLYQSAALCEALSWLLSELSARSYLMKTARLKSLEELKARAKTPVHRVVLVISELNHLSDEALKGLNQLLDRLEKNLLDVGIHVILNTRGAPQTPLVQRTLRTLKRRLSLSASSEEAKVLGCAGAEQLVAQQQDMILEMGTGPVRVHGWHLSARAYTTFLESYAQKKQARYICSQGGFEQLPILALRRAQESAKLGTKLSTKQSVKQSVKESAQPAPRGPKLPAR